MLILGLLACGITTYKVRIYLDYPFSILDYLNIFLISPILILVVVLYYLNKIRI